MTAYVRHAKRPGVFGAAQAHYTLWCSANEVRDALNEQNPAFAQTLLPATAGSAGPLPNAWPLVPAGVRWAVDETAPGTLTVTVDVAGPVAVRVVPPKPAAPFDAAVTLTATRATLTFPAVADGLYALTLSVAGSLLATVYVPVSRAGFRRFREHSRALRFGFRLPQPARPSAPYTATLARLIAHEAAAYTAQPVLAAKLLAAALAVPAPVTPTALYPRRAW